MHRNRAAGGLLLVAISGVAGLSGCGDDTEGAGTSTTVTIAATSYVTRQPATTTTTGGTTGGSTEASGGTASGEQLYTVQAGDFIARIAELYEVDIDELVNYNQWPEGAAHVIAPGDVVKIPPGGRVLEDGEGVTTDPPTEVTDEPGEEPTTTEGDDPTTRTTAQDDCSEGAYTIVEGDYPGAVAQKFDVTVEDLTAANAATAGYDSFYIGLEIVIPAPSDC